MVTDFPCMWVFVPENIQKPSHHGPRHPALCGLFWAGEIGPGDFMRSLQTWARWSFLASKRREGMLSGSQQLAEVQQDREEQAICNQQLIGGGLAKVWKMTLDVPKWDEEFVRVTKTWAWVPCQIELFSFDLDRLSWIQTVFPCCLLESHQITGCSAKFHFFLYSLVPTELIQHFLQWHLLSLLQKCSHSWR